MYGTTHFFFLSCAVFGNVFKSGNVFSYETWLNMVFMVLLVMQMFRCKRQGCLQSKLFSNLISQPVDFAQKLPSTKISYTSNGVRVASEVIILVDLQ